jgi:hypothetical protein
MKLLILLFLVSSFFCYDEKDFNLVIKKNGMVFSYIDVKGEYKKIYLNFCQQEKIVSFLKSEIREVYDQIKKKFDKKKIKFYYSPKSEENIYFNFEKIKDDENNKEYKCLKINDIYKIVYDWGYRKENFIFKKNDKNIKDFFLELFVKNN